MNKTINRSVLVIIPKKPFYDWGNSTTPNEKPINKLDECNSYLLDEGWAYADAEHFVKINFDNFFQELLEGMWTDEADWPQKRTWEMFNEWFDWHFSSMVWDIFDDKPFIYEEW